MLNCRPFVIDDWPKKMFNYFFRNLYTDLSTCKRYKPADKPETFMEMFSEELFEVKDFSVRPSMSLIAIK